MNQESDAMVALRKAYELALIENLDRWIYKPDEEKVDVNVRSLQLLDEMTKLSHISAPPSPWVCFNVETGEIGRAYEYKGEHRIRVIHQINEGNLNEGRTDQPDEA